MVAGEGVKTGNLYFFIALADENFRDLFAQAGEVIVVDVCAGLLFEPGVDLAREWEFADDPLRPGDQLLVRRLWWQLGE